MAETLLRRIRARIAGSLKTRVLMLTLGVLVAVAVPATAFFVWIVDATTVRLGTLLAEKQILYDRSRGLETLTREVGLAETLARSPIVMEWAGNEADPQMKRRGLAELEHYREAFAGHSYFFVVHASGNYYFNDRDGSYAGQQLRYTIQEGNPRDGWYFKTVADGPGCRLNVDRDDNLGVTNVWINCVVSENGRTLGVIGTGIDLTTFIREVVNSDQQGVDSLFVDGSGAVQAIRDAGAIEYHSLTTGMAAQKTIFRMADTDEDRAALRTMMAAVSSGAAPVRSAFVSMGGRQMLVGVGYLGEIGWYNIAVMDVDAMVDKRMFLPIGLLLAAMMGAAAALMAYLFKRSVLDRLAVAERSLGRVETGDFEIGQADTGSDEIARLSRALTTMARAMRDQTDTLEEAVRERTRQLEQIASRDMMTGMLNRRGFSEAHRLEQARAPEFSIGLILLDIDAFKSINDEHGHMAGDAVIVEAGRRIVEIAGPGHVCARWAGDEFVVLIPGASEAHIAETAHRILVAMREKAMTLGPKERVRVTTSVGGYLAVPGETLDSAMHKADMALYEAKRGGRNRFVAFVADDIGMDRPRVA